VRLSDLAQCPYCRQPFITTEITYLQDSDRELYEELSKVTVSCGNNSCEWTGKYGDHDEHLEVCEYRLESCIHCKRLIRHDRMTEHASTCLRAVLPCTKCRRSVERYRHQAHELTCPGLATDKGDQNLEPSPSPILSKEIITNEVDNNTNNDAPPVAFRCFNQKPKGLKFRWKFCVDSNKKSSPLFLKNGLLLQCVYQTIRTRGCTIQVKALLPGIEKNKKSELLYLPITLEWFITLLGFTEPVVFYKKEQIEWHNVNEIYRNKNHGICLPGEILALCGPLQSLEVNCKLKMQ